MDNDKIYTCCLCGKIKKGYGNDPWPLAPIFGTSNKCCDGCNLYKVIPARLESVNSGKNK